MKVHPHLASRQRYDDNIFLSPTAPVGSWINATSVGLGLELPVRNLYKTDVSYRGEFLSYSHRPGVQNAAHQILRAGLEGQFPRGARIQVRETFMDVTDPATSELVGRPRRIQNTLGAVFEKDFGRNLALGLDGQGAVHAYRDKDLADVLDRTETRFGLQLGYRIFPRTRLLGAYHVERIGYRHRPSRDSTSHFLEGGLEGQPAPKWRGVLKAGAQWRTYDRSVAGTPRGQTAGIFSTEVTFTPAERTQLVLSGSRNLVESAFTNNRFYRSNLAEMRWAQRWGIRWFQTVAGSFEHAGYPGRTVVAGSSKRRADDTYGARIEVRYVVEPYLQVVAGYFHRRRNSNLPVDYLNNVTEAVLELRF